MGENICFNAELNDKYREEVLFWSINGAPHLGDSLMCYTTSKSGNYELKVWTGADSSCLKSYFFEVKDLDIYVVAEDTVQEGDTAFFVDFNSRC